MIISMNNKTELVTVGDNMADRLLNTFGKRVRILRGDKTQEELVADLERFGVTVSQGHWSTIEKGKNIPNGKIIAAAARALGTISDYLLMLTDNPDLPKEDDTEGISEEAEMIASLVDRMTPERRQDAMAIIRALYSQDKSTQSPAARRFEFVTTQALSSIDDAEFDEIADWLRRYLDSFRRGGAAGASSA